MENFINNAPFALVLVCLVIGFVLLIKGADFFVEGSSSAAKRLHVPSIIIGLTIVAMGTSLPETAVSVSASLTGNNELAVSNVIGSNIFNLMVVIGVCAVVTNGCGSMAIPSASSASAATHSACSFFHSIVTSSPGTRPFFSRI